MTLALANFDGFGSSSRRADKLFSPFASLAVRGAELTRGRASSTERERPLKWTSAVDLGCQGFVMRQAYGYREQHRSLLPAFLDQATITNLGHQIGHLFDPVGHGVKVSCNSRRRHCIAGSIDRLRAQYNTLAHATITTHLNDGWTVET